MPQTVDSAATAAPTGAASRARQCVVALSLLVASLAICLLLYVSYVAPGPWLGAPPIQRWTAGELNVTRGTAKLSSGALVVAASDTTGTVVVSLNTSFRARDYPVIDWHAAGVPDNVEATLLWYSDINASRVFRRPMTVESGHLAPVPVGEDPGWLGHIGGLALVLQGGFAEPIVLRGAEAKPMSPTEVAGDRVREWLAFVPWTGASINGLTGGAQPQSLSLIASLAAAAALAGLAYAGLSRWKPRYAGSAAVGLAAIFFAAWMVADARWQWNLLRQAAATWRLYGAKTWEQRHLVAEDGPLFDFIQRVRKKLPPPPARVFMAAELPYFRARGAYHLYPYNVYYDPSSTAIPPPGVVRKGDYLVVYQRRGVQYDAAERRLRWDGNAPVAADLLLTGSGAALFEIR